MQTRYLSAKSRHVTIEALEDRCLLASLGNAWGLERQPVSDIDTALAATSQHSRVVGYDPKTKIETVSEGLPELDLAAAEQAAYDAGFDGLKGLRELLGRPAGGGEWVIGNDDRTLVPDTLAWPYSAVGRIWVSVNAPGGSFQENFTGVLIDPYHVLTSGDCLYTYDYGWASDLRFSPADNGNAILDESLSTYFRRSDFQFYGEAAWTYAHTYQAWTQNGNFNFDFGVITLDRRIGNFAGWYGYGYTNNNSLYTTNTATTLDYALDLTPDVQDMWMDTGNAANVFITPTQLYTSELDRYGSYGQPVSYVTPSGRVVYAVSTAEGFGCANPPCDPMPYNISTRISSAIFNDFGNWRSEDDLLRPPTDKADLVGLDEWFHSMASTVSSIDVAEGDPFSTTVYVRNNGTFASEPFTVSFYLAGHFGINADDIYLGTTFIDPLAPFSFAAASIDTIIPNIPPDQVNVWGQYFLGYIIDGEDYTTEYNETNNVGYYETNLINIRDDDHGNVAGSASVITPNLAVAGNIDYVGDRDWFSFAGMAGTQVSLRTYLGTLADSVLHLYAPDGTTELAVNNDFPGIGLASRIDYMLPADGTYYAVVEANGNAAASGTYSLTLTHGDDHGNSVAAATLIGAHTMTSGRIEIGGDTDTFSFYAENGTQVALATSLGSLADSTLTLLDAAGNSLAFDDDGGPGLASLISFTIPASGLYVARVAAYGNWQTGTYELSLEHLDDHADVATQATLATLNATQSGIIEVNGDRDFFQFQAMGGTAYTFSTRLGDLNDSTLTLYDRDGTTPLISNDNDGVSLASRIDWTAPTSGTYFVAVAGKAASFGSYDLIVKLRTNADGDFNADGLYDRFDIDLLVAQIAAHGNALAFDMNGDNLVNLIDRDLWLARAGGINLGPGRSYRLGDANLDGVVDGSDFGIWNAHKFTINPAWTAGDFSADGSVDGTDFGLWNVHKFQAAFARPRHPTHGTQLDQEADRRLDILDLLWALA